MNTALSCVVFDVDGTLVDSEQHGHRPAFNDAFERLGLPDRWDEPTYRELLEVTGGVRRLLSWFADPRSSLAGVADTELLNVAARLHRVKTESFIERCIAGSIPPRPGAMRLLEELHLRGIATAIATTGTRAWVGPLLDRTFGPNAFACIVTGDDVRERKPAPDAYLQVIDRLGLHPSGALLAIEDSAPGLRAALASGLPCVVVANGETDLDALTGASLITSGFGSPGTPTDVYHDPFGIVVDGVISVDVLVALAVQIAGPRPSRSDGGHRRR